MQPNWVLPPAEESPSCGRAHAHSVTVPVIEEEEGLVPSLLPLLQVGRSVIAVLETRASTKRRVRDGWSQWTSADFNASTSFCPSYNVEIWWRAFGMSITLRQQTCSRQQPTLWDSAAQQCTKHVTVVPASIRCQFSTLWRKSKNGVGTTLPHPLRNKLETLTLRCEVLWTKRLLVQRYIDA